MSPPKNMNMTLKKKSFEERNVFLACIFKGLKAELCMLQQSQISNKQKQHDKSWNLHFCAKLNFPWSTTELFVTTWTSNE